MLVDKLWSLIRAPTGPCALAQRVTQRVPHVLTLQLQGSMGTQVPNGGQGPVENTLRP